jgi:hypothetical protein
MANKKEIKRNKGGAPKKNNSEKIVKGISIYFNQKELDEFDEFISTKNLVQNKKSSLIKEITLKTIRNEDIILKKNADPKLFLALNKVGTNINQIAKKLNSLDKVSESDRMKFENALTDISKIINRL